MNDDNKSFLKIKKSAHEIEKDIEVLSLELTNSIKNQEAQLKDLNDEKILFDKSQVQTEIIKNQQLLIDEYKNNNNRLDSDLDEFQKKIKELDEANKKIKFYQDDNIRLSSEMNDTQKKYEIIKDNFSKIEKEKNDIFKQIQELNNSLLKNNIIGSPFLKEKIEEVNINSKVLNDITETNLKSTKTSTKDKDLNIIISEIFK